MIFIRYSRKLNLTNVYHDYSNKFSTSIKDLENFYPIEIYLKNMEHFKFIKKKTMDFTEGLKIAEELCSKYQIPNINQIHQSQILQNHNQNLNQQNLNLNLNMNLNMNLNLNNMNMNQNKNLDFNQKEEIEKEINASYIGMKGFFQFKLGKIKDAHENFKSAVELNQTDYRLYNDWAEMSENVLFTLKGTKLEKTWFENSLINNFMTIVFKLDKAKYIIPKIFYIIKKFPNQILGLNFEKYLDNIPTWVWIFWIPQIFEMLKMGITNSNNTFIFSILKKLANSYPQHIHYNLTFLLNSNIKEIFNLKNFDEGENLRANLEELKKILMKSERQNDSIKKIDIIMEEINKKMERNFDDIILNHLTNFINFRNTKKLEDTSNLIKKYITHLKNITNICGDYIVDILKEFDELFKKKNFDMYDLYEKIKNWRYFINSKRATRTNFTEIDQILEKNLCNLNFEEVEIPGYFTNKIQEPTAESVIYISRFESEFNFKFINYANKKLIIRGSNEKLYSFKIINEIFGKDNSDFKISQMQVLINQIFAKNIEAYRNNIKFNLPIRFQITNLYKIVQEDSLFYSLDEVYDFSMQKMGYDPEIAFKLYKEEYLKLFDSNKNTNNMNNNNKLFKKNGNLNENGIPICENLENLEVIKKVYSQMNKILPVFNLKNFIHKFIINCDEIFIFRKQFATSYALNNLLCNIFKLQDELYLDRISFNKETGSVTFHGMKYFKNDNLSNLLLPENNNNNINNSVQIKNINKKDLVPLRLSRNINVNYLFFYKFYFYLISISCHLLVLMEFYLGQFIMLQMHYY
jgi:hypothetical protein